MKKGWERKKLSELYQIGSSKRVLKSEWKTEGVPFYRGREVTRLAADGFVDNELFISEKHFAELAKQYGVPKAGDIVITAIGTIGNSHVVRDSDRFYFKDASVLWMKRVTDVSSEFVNLWLKSPLFFDQLDRGNGATVDTLTIQKLQSVGLASPTPSPSNAASSASSTRHSRASPPPKPTPKRTSTTPAPYSKATSNPCSPSAGRGGWRAVSMNFARLSSGGQHRPRTTAVTGTRREIPWILGTSDMKDPARLSDSSTAHF